MALRVVTTEACKGGDNAERSIWDHPSHKVAFRKQSKSRESMHDADERFAVSLISNAFKPMVEFVKCVV